MKLESVKLEKQVILNGQESICRAVHQSEPSLSLLDTTACPLVSDFITCLKIDMTQSIALKKQILHPKIKRWHYNIIMN